jgi:1-acyl-sn-glycerol-3-phosphate acyltransferase
MLFPEGTTNDADLTKQFYKGSFEIAAEVGASVVPTVLEFKDRSDYWVDGSLLAKSANQFARWSTYLHLWIGEPVTGTDAIELLETCQSQMDDKITEIQTNWGNSITPKTKPV